MKKMKFIIIIFLLLSPYFAVSQTDSEAKQEFQQPIKNFLKYYVNTKTFQQQINFQTYAKVALERSSVSVSQKSAKIYFNHYLAEIPLRENICQMLYDSLRNYLPEKYKEYSLSFYSNGEAIENLIPNYFKTTSEVRSKIHIVQNSISLVRPIENNYITKGLNNRNIALWQSHGWYYELKLDRWEWQRARLFTTVEDLLPTSFVIPYLIPMLQNAGAFVISPREIDIQLNEVIVDDADNQYCTLPSFMISSENGTGYATFNDTLTTENPFKQGSYSYGKASQNDSIVYIANIPESGEYLVYISFSKMENQGSVVYKVNHAGGSTMYEVQQNMGGGVWLPLGKHYFFQDADKESGSIVIYAPQGQNISTDAVRFGGGMGAIERGGKLSLRPKYQEAARYFLQYAGYPDTLVWSLNENNDYTDDYQCRGEWVNYLVGNPSGPVGDRTAGLGIPIDLSFGFHTDAGTMPADSVVGTLAIYSTEKNDELFYSGENRYASRDYADIVQTQIVEDIRKTYQYNWNRRPLWNSKYSEAYRPNVPAFLLELLSHQAFNDMQFALDPNFRFTVSRAIYKGMLRFLATYNNFEYVVQPLPVAEFKTQLLGDTAVKLSWKPVSDKLEPTAEASQFVVYSKTEETAFHVEIICNTTEIIIPIEKKNLIYSFKITARNEGGESFPSEILSVGIAENSQQKVLVINAFDRLESPQPFYTTEMSGFLRELDEGVAYIQDFMTVGNQYDFDRKSPWIDDDCPGHGASFADLETTIIQGNNFNYPFIHGKALMNGGFSFESMSDEAFENSKIMNSDYAFLDIILGEEKTERRPIDSNSPQYKIYATNFLQALEQYCVGGGSVFISGSYIGTDISAAEKEKVGLLLGFQHRTNHAVKNGNFYFTANPNLSYNFNTKNNNSIYAAESPDAIEPFNEKASTILRYSENNMSAGVLYKNIYKVFSLGFPFECIENEEERNELMKMIVKTLQ